MRMSMKRILCILAAIFCLTLCACRSRTTLGGQAGSEYRSDRAERADASLSGETVDAMADESDPAAETDSGDAGGEQTRENPEADRREYDENAPAEIVSGTDRAVHTDGEGEGAPNAGEGDSKPVSKLNDTAENVAAQTVAAEQAEQVGVSEAAEAADSAMTYFTVLLEQRTGALFECQRQSVYWETAEERVTVYKTSLEHNMIVGAGAYDVSARLLEENLRVDDGWVVRKNPGVIVKIVDGGVLGTGVYSTAAAQKACTHLLGREGWKGIDAVRNRRIVILSEELLSAPHLQTAAMIIIAKTASPALFDDVDADKMLEMLAEEATGSLPAGIYYYTEQGDF